MLADSRSWRGWLCSCKRASHRVSRWQRGSRRWGRLQRNCDYHLLRHCRRGQRFLRHWWCSWRSSAYNRRSPSCLDPLRRCRRDLLITATRIGRHITRHNTCCGRPRTAENGSLLQAPEIRMRRCRPRRFRGRLLRSHTRICDDDRLRSRSRRHRRRAHGGRSSLVFGTVQSAE